MYHFLDTSIVLVDAPSHLFCNLGVADCLRQTGLLPLDTGAMLTRVTN